MGNKGRLFNHNNNEQKQTRGGGMLIGFLCVLGTAAPAYAQCPLIDLPDFVRNTRIAVVFRGRVRTVEPAPVGQIVTFAVERVWKGEVPEVVTIYNQQGESAVTRSSEAVTFERERVYLVAAHRHTVEDRGRFDITSADPETLGTSACHAYQNAPTSITEKVPGYPPSRSN